MPWNDPVATLPRASYNPTHYADVVDPAAEVRLPVPYVVSLDTDGSVDWLGFDAAKAEAAQTGNLCQVCGSETVTGERVHLMLTGTEAGKTSGTAVHANCALNTLKMCPHYRFSSIHPETVVAWLWTGNGQGAVPEISPDDPDWQWFDVSAEYLIPAPGSVPLTYGQLRGLADRERRR